MGIFETKINLNKLVRILLIILIAISVMFIVSFYSPKVINIIEYASIDYKFPPEFYFQFGHGENRLQEPSGIAVDSKGNLYISDLVDKKIKIFSPNGKFIRAIGDKNLFNAPVDLAIFNDRLVVSDSFTFQVKELTLDGKFVKDLITEPLRKKIGAIRPCGLAFNQQGELYLTDVFYHRIVVFDPDGEYSFSFGGPGNNPGQFSYPNDVAVDNEGYIYVSDSNNQRVQIFYPDGKPLSIANSEKGGIGFNFGMNRGVTVEGERLHVIDAWLNQVIVFDITDRGNPTLLHTYGKGVSEEASLYFSSNLIVKDNLVYVADTDKSRIAVFEYK